MTLVTEEVKKILRLPEWPSGLIIELVEYEHYISLRLFRDNFESFDGEDKRHIAGIVGQTIKKIRDIGIPCYLEVEKGDGNVSGSGLVVGR